MNGESLNAPSEKTRENSLSQRDSRQNQVSRLTEEQNNKQQLFEASF